MTERRVAVEIVEAIVKDLTSRVGLVDEWSAIDRETQVAIVETWTSITETKIRAEFSA